MDDMSIHDQISALVEEERRLRDARVGQGAEGAATEERRLHEVEAQLDRLWDLLRQRDARREFGESPDGAHERPARIVENYEG